MCSRARPLQKPLWSAFGRLAENHHLPAADCAAGGTRVQLEGTSPSRLNSSGDRRQTFANTDIIDDLLHALAKRPVLQPELFDETSIVDQIVSGDLAATGLRFESNVRIGQEFA